MALLKHPLLTEASADLIINQVKLQFNLLLQELDNTYVDGTNLEPLDDEAIHISDKIQTLTLPALYVLYGSHAFDYTENPNWLNSEDEVIVVLTAEDVGADVLTRKMWRYGRVLFGCLNLIDLNDSTGRLKIRTVPTRLGYTTPITDKLQKEEQRFRGDVVLELKVMHFENNLTV
jgi:hypothetical protein